MYTKDQVLNLENRGGVILIVLGLICILVLACQTNESEDTRLATLPPAPSAPTDGIVVIKEPSFRVILQEVNAQFEQDDHLWATFSVENYGSDLLKVGGVRVEDLMFKACDLIDGRYSAGYMVHAAGIPSQDWLQWDANRIGSTTTERVIFRSDENDVDVWAKEYTETEEYLSGWHFVIYPSRWVNINVGMRWPHERFGNCVRLSVRIGDELITLPLTQ